MRRHYRQRRLRLLDTLVRHTPGTPATGMDAGLHVLWHLPPGADEEAVVRRCRQAGLAVLGLARCRIGHGPPGLVLGCANLPPHHAEHVAQVLADAMS